MNFTFDYYKNLEQIDLELCNPDGKELFFLPGRERRLTLRFNDLSELTFQVDSKITAIDGTQIDLEAYDYIEVKRLIYATNIGWFQISDVVEQDDGKSKFKTVTAESYQAVFKNKGFISEERVYCFYNPSDPRDDRYDSSKDDAIPSVIGQLAKQLGVSVEGSPSNFGEIIRPYDDWTIVYIPEELWFRGDQPICRTFKENTSYGYDWMVKDVEEAFEVVFIFDFLNKAIQIKTPEEITKEKANVIYTFDNFMKNIEITEDSKDIVTVLNCNGDNCDITMVNPTGTNYICDFSYYMDEVNHHWMSQALIEKLKAWKKDCEERQEHYMSRINTLREALLAKTKVDEKLKKNSLFLQDLKNAQAHRGVVAPGDDDEKGTLCGVVMVESVDVGERSLDPSKGVFSLDKKITAYASKPVDGDYDAKNKVWKFNGASSSVNIGEISSEDFEYLYFTDDYGETYCKIRISGKLSEDLKNTVYSCEGYDRFIAYTYPSVKDGKTAYTDELQTWIDFREELVRNLTTEVNGYQSTINNCNRELKNISSQLNIISYFSDTPDLLKELNCYWFEGDYENENIAVLESTTPAEEMRLSIELLESGRKELAKVCQPHYSFSLSSMDITKSYEFREQAKELELGKIITIEKEEGLWYYPALLEIELSLDNADDFNLTFANAMRLDDWGYTYADLISDASSTSRKISANWQDILSYSKERDEIISLIREPLDATLRASFANMTNQEFTIDSNGILGRKKTSEDEFDKRQLRMINNVLLFTDDGWETAKTAIGEITLPDGGGTTYGLIAETIIGELVLGNDVQIRNGSNSIVINDEGLTIKKGQNETFSVDTNGNITLSGNITWNTNSNPVKVLYRTNPVKVLYRRDYTSEIPNKDYTSYPEYDSSGGWHTEPNIGYDEYVSFNTKEGSADNWSEALSYYDYDIDGILTFKAPEYSYDSYYYYSDYLWHQTFDGENDFYASYSYDGGINWGEPVRIVGSNGKDGKPAKELTDTEIAELLTGLNHGLTWVDMYDEESEGWASKLCVKGDYIAASESLYIGSSEGGYLSGYNGSTTKVDEYYIIDNNGTVDIRSLTNGICLTKAYEANEERNDIAEKPVIAISDGGAKMSWVNRYEGSYFGDYREYYTYKDIATVYVTSGGSVGIEYENKFTINGGTVTFELVE